MNIIDVNLRRNGSMNMTNVPKMLIVHHIEAEGSNWTIQMINDMHINENGWSMIGYHYYIRLDGSVYKGRPDNAIGAHCQGANTNSLGIAFEGNYDKRSEMPSEQFNAWCELKSYLINKYGSMPVYGHREKGSSECPGKNFPLQKVKDATATKYKIGWTLDSTGWYYSYDGTHCYVNSWQLINDLWYSFDPSGYARHSTWLQDGGKWYYLNDDCSMAFSEWLQIKGVWYRFNEAGAMLSNTWYANSHNEMFFLDPSGAMVTGPAVINGKQYVFNNDGVLIS